jgi:protein-S-isoprenylcysteine O-methyltransferase Ste14
VENNDLLQLNSWLWIAWGTYWIIAARFVQRAKESEGIALRLQHLIPTAVGFILIFNIFQRVWICGPIFQGPIFAIVGLMITACGLAFATWARIHLGKYWSGIITLKEGHRLIRSGPYAIARHPIYTGFLLGALGSAITAGTGDAAIGLLVLFVAYFVKIKREETVLLKEFGKEYARFKAEVATLVPLVF